MYAHLQLARKLAIQQLRKKFIDFTSNKIYRFEKVPIYL